MEFEAVKSWLEKFTNKRIKGLRTAGIIGLVCTPFAIALAVALLYALLAALAHERVGSESYIYLLWISFALVPVMFLGNRLVPRRNLMEEAMESGQRASRISVRLQFFLWIMFAGPRLIDWSIEKFRKAKALETQDTHSCAAVLWLLLSRHKKVPYEEIQRELPWLNMETAIPEARNIPGVLHLRVEPAGLSPTQNLRVAVRSGKFEIEDA